MDWKTFGVSAIIFLLIGAFLGGLLTKKQIIVREVPVKLTPAVLDSLELAFSLRVKAKREIVLVKDPLSAQEADSLRGVVAEMCDAIQSVGSYKLSYHSDSLGRYGDTLDVVVSIPTDSIMICFGPRERDYFVQIVDTVFVPARDEGIGVWDVVLYLGLFAGGVFVGGTI